MNDALADTLLELLAKDEATRAKLVESGELFDGYHPEMAAVHLANAARLAEIIETWGWPGETLVGKRAANAAWIILQHAIGSPELMRRCLPLLTEAAARGDVPPEQSAYLHDRICAFEGRPQRYGTQFDWDEEGKLSPGPLEDEERVDAFRAGVGLGPLQERLTAIR